MKEAVVTFAPVHEPEKHQQAPPRLCLGREQDAASGQDRPGREREKEAASPPRSDLCTPRELATVAIAPEPFATQPVVTPPIATIIDGTHLDGREKPRGARERRRSSSARSLPDHRGIVGAFIGALVGALVGALIGALVGTLIGAFVGAFVGALVVGRRAPFRPFISLDVTVTHPPLTDLMTSAGPVKRAVNSEVRRTGRSTRDMTRGCHRGVVGALVGAFIGALVGALIGALVGAFVGALVGAFDGVLVGAVDGELDLAADARPPVALHCCWCGGRSTWLSSIMLFFAVLSLMPQLAEGGRSTRFSEQDWADLENGSAETSGFVAWNSKQLLSMNGAKALNSALIFRRRDALMYTTSGHYNPTKSAMWQRVGCDTRGRSQKPTSRWLPGDDCVELLPALPSGSWKWVCVDKTAAPNGVFTLPTNLPTYGGIFPAKPGCRHPKLADLHLFMSAEGLRMLSVVREVRRSYPALDLLARSTPLPQSLETCDALQAAAATITFSASSLALVTDELEARFPAWSTQTNGQRGRTRGSAHAAGAAARDALVLLAPSLQRTFLEAAGITKEYLNSIGYVFDTPGSAAPAAAAPVVPAQPQQPTTGTCPAITNFDDCVCGWGTAFTKQRRRKSDSPTTTAQQAVLNRLARRCVYANCHKKALRALALQMGRPQSQPTIASSQSTQLMANVRLVEFVLQSIVKLQLHRNFVVEQLARRCDGANIIVVDREKCITSFHLCLSRLHRQSTIDYRGSGAALSYLCGIHVESPPLREGY